jgi:hypothetical protein
MLLSFRIILSLAAIASLVVALVVGSLSAWICFAGVALLLAVLFVGPRIARTATASAMIGIAGLVAPVVTALFNGTQFLRITGIVQPDYTASVTPPDIVLRQAAHLRLSATWKDGTSYPLNGYTCKWTLGRSLPPPEPPGSCDATITAAPDVFGPGDQEMIIVPIAMVATSPGGTVRKFEKSIHLHNLSRPDIQGLVPTLELGEARRVEVGFPEGLVPKNYSCLWSPPQAFSNTGNCKTSMIATLGLAEDNTDGVKVQVEVDADNLRLMSDEHLVKIILPPARLYDFVLDATTNMAPVFSGTTLFDSARGDILREVSRTAADGGWLSVTAFGQQFSPPRDDCNRVGDAYQLSPIQAQKADTAIKSLQMVGHVAPLATAIDYAVQRYADLRPRYRGDTLMTTFTILTASVNACSNQSLADALARIPESFNRRGLRLQYYGQRIFSSVVLIAPAGSSLPHEIVGQPFYTQDRNKTILFVAHSPDDEAKIVEAIVNLLDPGRRRAACGTLRGFIRQQEGPNSAGERILEPHCG